MDTQALTSFGFLALIFGVFYFITIRPQMKQQKKLQNMRKSLEKGDKIVTIGGFYGKVFAIKDDMVTVELKPDSIKVQMLKSAIGNVINPETEKVEVESKEKDK